MSRIIGIDPGKTVGLCLYDTQARRVLQSGQATSAVEALRWVRQAQQAHGIDAIGIERPRIYQSAGNELCDTIEQTGWLVAMLGGAHPPETRTAGVHICPQTMAHDCEVYLLERRAVTNAMTEAMGSTVRGDAGVWQALCAMHPDAVRSPVAGVPGRAAEPPRLRAGSKTKWTKGKPEVVAVPAVEAGPLYGVTSHARAALAVAWALGRYLEDK